MGVNGVNSKEVVVIQGGVPVAGTQGNGEKNMVSVHGTEIIKQNDVTLKPDTSVPTNLPSAKELALYFGEKQADKIQDEYRDIKSDLDKQVKEFKALYPDFKLDLPQLKPYTDFMDNKKGAQNFRDQFANYQEEVEQALTLAKFEAKHAEETSVKKHISQEADAIMMNNNMNTQTSMINDNINAQKIMGNNNANAEAIMKNDDENAKSINKNVDQEGAATRGTVRKEGKATRRAVHSEGAFTRTVVRREGQSTRDAVYFEAEVAKMDRNEKQAALTDKISEESDKIRNNSDMNTQRVINNNNEQTEILDPLGVNRTIHGAKKEAGRIVDNVVDKTSRIIDIITE